MHEVSSNLAPLLFSPSTKNRCRSTRTGALCVLPRAVGKVPGASQPRPPGPAESGGLQAASGLGYSPSCLASIGDDGAATPNPCIYAGEDTSRVLLRRGGVNGTKRAHWYRYAVAFGVLNHPRVTRWGLLWSLAFLSLLASPRLQGGKGRLRMGVAFLYLL